MLGALTLLRGVRLETTWDLASIVRPGSANNRVMELVGRVREFWAELKPRLGNKGARKSSEWKRFHLTTRSGPGGGHALLQALRDLVTLPEELVESLRFLGGRKFRFVLDFLLKDKWVLGKIQRLLGALDPRSRGFQSQSVRIPPADWGIPEDYYTFDWGDEGYTPRFPFRRLILIPDKEGKTREVAVFDY